MKNNFIWIEKRSILSHGGMQTSRGKEKQSIKECVDSVRVILFSHLCPYGFELPGCGSMRALCTQARS